MKIFYIEVEKFKNRHDKSFLEPYCGMKIKNEKRFYEYSIGRYLVKNVAKSIYNLKNTDIILDEKGKPVFKDEQLFFNISHSKNIVIACFSDMPCGVDIEYIKKRDLEKFSKYYKKNFKNLDEFYQFWTLKEAVYKLGNKATETYSTKFKDEYYIALASNKQIELEINEFS